MASPASRRLGGDGAEERVAGALVDGAGQPDAPGDALGGDEQPRPEPAGGPERDHRCGAAIGAGEVGGELEDAAHLGPAEPVDRLVRVADDDEVAAVAGEGAEQGHLAGVGVLVLVDEDVLELTPQLVAVGRRLDHRAADQVGVVGGGLVVEVVEVAAQEQPRGDEDRSLLGLAQR